MTGKVPFSKIPFMEDYINANRKHWDELVPINVASEYYAVSDFLKNPDRLNSLELEEVGDVRGKSLLHLQCHFGIDTISWARQGAIATGVDFSPNAIKQARSLAAELGVSARFIDANIYDLPKHLDEQFDIVFTSYGVIWYLDDLKEWAKLIARFLKPGGTFYIVEFHPFPFVIDPTAGNEDLVVRHHYFRPEHPTVVEVESTYANPEAPIKNKAVHYFAHPLGSIITSLIEAGLRLEFLHEFPFNNYHFLPFTERRADKKVVLKKHHGSLPLLFSIKATK